MKKTILLLVGISLFTGSVFSQIKYGFALGANTSTLKGDAMQSLNNVFDLTNGIVSQSSHTGISARVFSEIPVSEKFSVEPGLSFNQRGYSLKGELTSTFLKLLNANASLSVTTNYVGVDLLAKINPVGGLSIKLGPQVNYLAGSDLKLKASVLGFNLVNEKIDITGNMKKIDAGLTGAIQYEFSNGVSISGFYTHGLSPVDENSNFKAYNRTAGITLGFSF